MVFKNTNAILKLVGALLTEKVDEIFIECEMNGMFTHFANQSIASNTIVQCAIYTRLVTSTCTTFIAERAITELTMS